MTIQSAVDAIKEECENQSAQQNSGHELFATIGPMLDALVLDGVVIEDLPTSDPLVAGKLWNDTGTPTVSAG